MTKQYVLTETETKVNYTFYSRKSLTEFIILFELNNFTVKTEYISVSI